MKYEVILKVKYQPSGTFEQIGRIIVNPEHLKAQSDAYNHRASKMNISNHIVLINELDDNGDFIRVIR